MSASTDDEFEYSLDDDLAWRRIELASIATSLRTSAKLNQSSPATRALSRALCTLLYAHWEGYVKHVFEGYMRLLHRRKPRVHELSDALLEQHLLQLLRRLDAGEIDARVEVLDVARGASSHRINLGRSRIVDTKSNLRATVLKDIMTSLGLDAEVFASRSRLIDVLLCDRRNDIAHGRANFPPPGEVLDLYAKVIGMMEEVRELTIAQVRTRGYRADAVLV